MLTGATVAGRLAGSERQKWFRGARFRGLCGRYTVVQRICERGRKLILPGQCDRARHYLAKAHRQVEGANVLGQRTHGDEIDTGFSKLA